MLTCPQILNRIAQFDSPITDNNFRKVAARIHPPCDWQDPHEQDQIHLDPTLQAIYRSLDQLPAVLEAHRALDFKTPDFADLALRMVVLWQANAAKMRYWLDNVVALNLDDEPQMSPKRTTDDLPFDHQAGVPFGPDFIQLTRKQRRFRHVLITGRPRIVGNPPNPVGELAEPVKPPPATSKYQLSIRLTTGNATPISQINLHCNERYTATTAYTKLIIAVQEDLWRFMMEHEQEIKTTAPTPTRPTKPNKTPEPITNNGNVGSTTNDSTDSPEWIPF